MELQRTSEWRAQRLGKFTSSCVWKLMTDPREKSPLQKYEDAFAQLEKWKVEYEGTKNKETKTANEKLNKIKALEQKITFLYNDRHRRILSDTAITYILEKIVEEIGGFIPDVDSNATIYGTNQEPEAKFWYEKLTRLETQEVGFMHYNDDFGGSPDALVLDRETNEIGGLEVKCPYNSVNHLKYRIINSAEYFKENHFDHYWQCYGNMLVSNSKWWDFVSFDPRIDNEIGFFRFRLYRDDEEMEQLVGRIAGASEYKTKLKIQLGLL